MFIVSKAAKPKRISIWPTTEDLPTTDLRCRPSLQLQPDVHKVVRRPWAGVLEVQALAVFLGNAVHGGDELGFFLAVNDEGGVHDHLVADGLVDARGDAYATQRFVDVAHV